MDKELVLTKITDVGVVAVVRAESGERPRGSPTHVWRAAFPPLS